MAIAVAVDDVLEQRDRLLARLAEQRERVSELWSWYRGHQDVPDVPAKYQAAYRLFLEEAATPWARLVVDAISERLRVQGFRAGEDREAADSAWRTFIRSRMQADQRLVYSEALIGGCGYVSVARTAAGEVAVVPESAFEVTHEPDLADRGVVAAALKLYPLTWDRRMWVCELYRPEATHRWIVEPPWHRRDDGAFPIDNARRAGTLDWQSVGAPTYNDAETVPVVPFQNRTNILDGGASEIDDCVPVLQRIDRLTLDLLLTSHVSSYRQRWATGLVVPRDPDTGRPVEPFKAAVERLWINERPDGKFGSFEASDLNQYLVAIDSQIATLAAISRVPSHYLLQRNLANPPSAESLIAAETGLVAKVQDRQAQYGEAWQQVVALALRMAGEAVDVAELETQWVDAEKRNPAQVADSAIKMQSVGVPRSALWEYLGASPQQVREWQAEEAASQLLAAATAAASQPLPALSEATAAPEQPGVAS